MDPVFRAVADPTRRAMLQRLARGELAASELGAGFPISQPAVSQHLRTLREAGLVSERRVGRQRRYRLEAGALREAHAWTAQFERFWSGALDDLERVLDGRKDG